MLARMHGWVRGACTILLLITIVMSGAMRGARSLVLEQDVTSSCCDEGDVAIALEPPQVVRIADGIASIVVDTPTEILLEPARRTVLQSAPKTSPPREH